MSNKEINMLIYSAFDLDISLYANITSHKAFIKRNAVLIIVIKVTLHKDNVITKPLSLDQDRKISIV